MYDDETVMAPPPTIENLVLFLTFDQTANVDQSGNGNNAIGIKNRGPGYFLSQGYSAHFNGEKNIEVPSSESINRAFSSEFSFSLWIFVNKFGTLTTEQCDIVSKGEHNAISFAFTVDMVNRQLMVTTDSEDAGKITLTSNAKLLNQRWTHVTVTRADKIMVLYVNGNLDAVAEVRPGRKTKENPLYIGRVPWQDRIGGGCNIDFFFDEFKVWDKVLDESWIEAEAGFALGAGTDPHSIQLG